MLKNPFIYLLILLPALLHCGDGKVGGQGTVSGGAGGSTSRFSVSAGHLYAIGKFGTIKVFTLDHPATPMEVGTFYSGIDPETIHSNGERLFLAGRLGMSIYTLEDPRAPEKRGTVRHATSCDPVVVQGETAYITLRSGNENCIFGNRLMMNEFQVVDISDIDNPDILSSLPMLSPWGLGVSREQAYVCDGSRGLQVLSVADPLNTTPLASVMTEICFDVIALEDRLITTGATGIGQYKLKPDDPIPHLLSRIELLGNGVPHESSNHQ